MNQFLCYAIVSPMRESDGESCHENLCGAAEAAAVVSAAVDQVELAVITIEVAGRNTYRAYCAMSIRP
jgi:hypothetical protein